MRLWMISSYRTACAVDVHVYLPQTDFSIYCLYTNIWNYVNAEKTRVDECTTGQNQRRGCGIF